MPRTMLKDEPDSNKTGVPTAPDVEWTNGLDWVLPPLETVYIRGRIKGYIYISIL